MGKALAGPQVGDRPYVQVNEQYGYYVEVRSIEKGTDDGSVPSTDSERREEQGERGARRKRRPPAFPAVYPHRWRSRLAMVK